ncbi:Hypothetical protein LUCI_5033 [Lucifera butyrica]|uniref:Peptidase M16C associated domain-containing protein n=1 Tax=Lucifera butyrica TaxID=1351585 RepID=A0A498RFE7_9FIRM|nr:insulinase family protein [Lucifera butyrica]VBB09735.1 Hypothetical protein LUCI_5033 [Lucifera butyrica]
MEWKKGNIYHGFRLEAEKQIEDIRSLAKIFYHEQSGARLFFLENDDDNKVFSITFRTPPADSTGLPHIMEHSVLCGSRKFPLREPFVELAKGSLNTYLNAMTYPDKTMYPIASRNPKDFRNLMDVYLDAVFYPNLYDCPETLMQEGWHYELEDPQGEITYKGVVYNEMKGALSAPDAILESHTLAALYPDTAYGFESGGDPEVIPQLTQAQFIQFHRQYYHPANAYIYLYGDMDLLEQLQFLDESYLRHFNKTQIDSTIKLQPAFSRKVEKVFEYSIGMNEQAADKTFMSMNFVVGQTKDAELALAGEILEYLLLETPAAPLKKALLEAGVGKDVKGSFVRCMLQPLFSIIVSGTNESEKEKFVRTVDRELKRLVAEGIDKKLIEACINLFEFRLREANYGIRPKGLVYNAMCLDSWLYDESPVLHLEYMSSLEKIKRALTTDYFEQLIQRYLLDNNHQALVILRPQPGMAAAKDQAVREELARYKASLSPAAIDELIANTARLKLRQQTPDSPAALASIPLLTLKDIEPRAAALPLNEKKEQEIPVLFHSLPTNGIAYVNLYFDTRHVPAQYLSYVYLLAEMLGKISTEKYDYTELSNEVNIHTGGITNEVAVYTEKDNTETYYPKFIIKSKAFVTKLPELAGLLKQIIAHSRFDQAKRIGELVQEVKSRWDANLFSRGRVLAVNRVLSYFSASAQYSENGMLAFYDFIAGLERDYATGAAEIMENLAKVTQAIFTRSNLLVSVTADEAAYAAFQRDFSGFYSCLPASQGQDESCPFEPARGNEGFMTAGKVQYVVKAANFRRLGYSYHGCLKVAETILSYDYLWTRVRVQGGAYGGFAGFESNGNLVFSSYRDPNLKETLTAYDETADYLRQFPADERELTKYIIGTISRLDAALAAAQKGEQAAIRYIRHISRADLQRERDEILATRRDDIRQLAGLVEAAMKQDYFCVLGSEQKLRENAGLFKQIRNVLK